VIPGDAFAPGEAPTNAKIPTSHFPTPIVLAYREGVDNFTIEDQDPPFSVEYEPVGDLSATIEAGQSLDGFGFRVNFIREGVYGTLLVDRINMDLTLSNLGIEHCPDITDEIEETSSPVIPTFIEDCPPLGVVTEETSLAVPFFDE